MCNICSVYTIYHYAFTLYHYTYMCTLCYYVYTSTLYYCAYMYSVSLCLLYVTRYSVCVYSVLLCVYVYYYVYVLLGICVFCHQMFTPYRYLLQHGESLYNVLGRIGGDAPLSLNGEQVTKERDQIWQSELQCFGVCCVTYISQIMNYIVGHAIYKYDICLVLCHQGVISQRVKQFEWLFQFQLSS